MNSAFDVSYEASLYGTSDEDSCDNVKNEIRILNTLGDYKSQVIKENYAALVKSSQLQSEAQLDPDPDVKTVKETKPPPISENEEGQSGVSFVKEPDSKSASVEEKIVNNENAERLLENNIETETNYLRIPEKLSIQKKINKSLQPDEETYELEKFKKNAMIIFNHENFLVGDRRLGTALDVAALEDIFKQFRFVVTTRNDLTQQDLFDELERFSKMNFKEYGCICVAILTHGQDGGFLRAYDTRYKERDAFSCFNALANSTLVAKPIIFLIQACRGSTTAARVPYGHVLNVEFDAEISENSCRPTESDMIIFHSSFFGRASVRVVEEGSWFIQTVCEQMKLHGSTDHLEKLFRRVRRIVALDKEYKGVKQMPAVTTTLLKKLYLNKIDDHCKQIDGSNSEKVISRVTVKTKVKNVEVKRLTLTVFKYAHRFVIALLLTLLILHQDVTVSSCILILFLFLFELIRYKVFKAYIALFKQVHHFTIFLVLFNFFFRSFLYYFKGQDDVMFFVYLFGCWYFIGVTYIIFMFGTMYVIYEYLNLL